jgi:hypothetical protein
MSGKYKVNLLFLFMLFVLALLVLISWLRG